MTSNAKLQNIQRIDKSTYTSFNRQGHCMTEEKKNYEHTNTNSIHWYTDAEYLDWTGCIHLQGGDTNTGAFF